MLSKTRGIVLRTMPYNDKSSIIYMYTENFGRRSYLVRWSQRKGGLFSKALFMPFSVLDLEVIHWPKRELHQIKECRIDFPTNRIATDPVRSALAQFLAEVLFRGVQDTEPDQRLFDYLLHSIHLLETSDEGIPNFHLVFLLGLPHYLGIFPNLESYQECKIKLSELSQEECIRFIESRDIKIPESLEGLRNTGALVKNMIWYAEDRPWSQMKYDSPETTRLGEMIRRAVNDYYGYDGSPYNFTGGLFVF